MFQLEKFAFFQTRPAEVEKRTLAEVENHAKSPQITPKPGEGAFYSHYYKSPIWASLSFIKVYSVFFPTLSNQTSTVLLTLLLFLCSKIQTGGESQKKIVAGRFVGNRRSPVGDFGRKCPQSSVKRKMPRLAENGPRAAPSCHFQPASAFSALPSDFGAFSTEIASRLGRFPIQNAVNTFCVQTQYVQIKWF